MRSQLYDLLLNESYPALVYAQVGLFLPYIVFRAIVSIVCL